MPNIPKGFKYHKIDVPIKLIKVSIATADYGEQIETVTSVREIVGIREKVSSNEQTEAFQQGVQQIEKYNIDAGLYDDEKYIEIDFRISETETETRRLSIKTVDADFNGSNLILTCVAYKGIDLRGILKNGKSN